MDLAQLGLFLLTASVLLGSPGPGIAALVAVGRQQGFADGLRFYGGMQLGLALVFAVSAAGLFSLIRALPWAMPAMTLFSAIYLAWLAWRFATAPVGPAARSTTGGFAATARDGLLLALSNPKAYLAIIALMATYPIVTSDPRVDASLKWLLCVILAVVVDILWLWIGGVMRKAAPSASRERLFNWSMGAVILCTALLSVVEL